MTMVTVIIFMVMRNRNNYEDSKFILEQQRFIVVDDSDDKNLYRSYFENGYDLRSNNSYSKTQVVVKNGKKYGSYSDEKPSDRYHRDLYRNITSAILNLKVSKVEIEKSNFIIERDPKSLITKSLVKEGKTPDFEAKVINKKNQFSKVRITYNQDYLPIKLEWYFKGKDGLKWYTWSRFSYPYKTESEFNKKLDEEIQRIKDIKEEYELEKENG
ncbi:MULTISPECIES: hypothetical protein [Streptococcus]|nr:MULTISPECIES: hypothetical protein [Streptococcus]MEE0220107.1 hypothetical protein [Streptococcus sp.]MCB6479898.1 hypothetical protein [Streptococcus parasanguinis]MCB7061198.1 hypothetical protein [Streptococcus sp. 210928-DFI.4.42]MCQ5186265.1 hypothetical protein [Streptococcus parasanguinis]MEE0499639.1 hypothetical protein [Streptococcus sp.]